MAVGELSVAAGELAVADLEQGLGQGRFMQRQGVAGLGGCDPCGPTDSSSMQYDAQARKLGASSLVASRPASEVPGALPGCHTSHCFLQLVLVRVGSSSLRTPYSHPASTPPSSSSSSSSSQPCCARTRATRPACGSACWACLRTGRAWWAARPAQRCLAPPPPARRCLGPASARVTAQRWVLLTPRGAVGGAVDVMRRRHGVVGVLAYHSPLMTNGLVLLHLLHAGCPVPRRRARSRHPD